MMFRFNGKTHFLANPSSLSTFVCRPHTTTNSVTTPMGYKTSTILHTNMNKRYSLFNSSSCVNIIHSCSSPSTLSIMVSSSSPTSCRSIISLSARKQGNYLLNKKTYSIKPHFFYCTGNKQLSYSLCTLFLNYSNNVLQYLTLGKQAHHGFLEVYKNNPSYSI